MTRKSYKFKTQTPMTIHFNRFLLFSFFFFSFFFSIAKKCRRLASTTNTIHIRDVMCQWMTKQLTENSCQKKRTRNRNEKKCTYEMCVTHSSSWFGNVAALCTNIWNFYQWIKLLCCLNGRVMVGKRERGGWEKWAKLPIDVRLTRFSWPRKRKMNCRRTTLTHTHTHNGFRTHVKNTAISSQTDSHKLAQCGK